MGTLVKTLFLFVPLIFGFTLHNQQNLVPNPSFEQFNLDHCGLSVSVKKFESDNLFWTSPTIGKPHTYSKLVDKNCWNHISADSPDQPKTGNRMIMICNYAVSGFRSYVQVRLKDLVREGKDYEVKLWILVPHDANAFSPTLGIYLSPDQKEFDTIFNIQELATIEFNTDWKEGSWAQLTGKFRPKVDSEYLIIGNFKGNDQTQVNILIKDSDDPVSFLYVDDVELTSMD